MQMTMTAAEVKAFMDELDKTSPGTYVDGLHADYIGFIAGATYRDRHGHDPVEYRCIHRTPCYATFEATDPRTGEVVSFRRSVHVFGFGHETAYIGYDEMCKSPFYERRGIKSTDVA